MSNQIRVAAMLVFAMLCFACSYGPERTALSLGNVLAKPKSHILAVSLDYARVKSPNGALNTFPNGGVPKLIYREARVYRCDLDAGTVELVAAVPDFGGIPQAKSVSIQGWKQDELYFSLFGYGGNSRTGDDYSDKRWLYFRVTADGTMEEVDHIPSDLERAQQTEPLEPPPFLRWSKGHRDIRIAIDARVSGTSRQARLTFDEETGEPYLLMP